MVSVAVEDDMNIGHLTLPFDEQIDQFVQTAVVLSDRPDWQRIIAPDFVTIPVLVGVAIVALAMICVGTYLVDQDTLEDE